MRKKDNTDLEADGIESDGAIKRRLQELKALVDKDKISTAIVQRSLRCAYPQACDIIEALKTKKREKFDDNFFNMDNNKQYNYLHSLIDKVSALLLIDYDYTYFSRKLAMELERIEKSNLIPYFLLAQSVATILISIDNRPHFVGVGCCSLVAFVIGITEKSLYPLEQSLNPLEHGLIFERGFRQDYVSDCSFNFYVEDDIKENFLSQLKERFGENVTYAPCDNRIFLRVNDVQIGIINSIDGVQDFYRDPKDLLENSTNAMFTEEYMHLLHFVGGYSYDEADDIRLAMCKKNRLQVDKYRRDFISRTNSSLRLGESSMLFDNIAKGIVYSFSKAALLSAKVIIDDHAAFILNQPK